MEQARREPWPAPAQQASLRMAAMMAMGTLRLDTWRQKNAAYPLAHYLRENFEHLKSQI
jgi:hypothetical protein